MNLLVLTIYANIMLKLLLKHLFIAFGRIYDIVNRSFL